MHRPSILASSLAIVLCSCDGGGGGGGGGPTPPGEGAPVASIEGVWETPCLPAADAARSRHVLLSVTGAVFVRTETAFFDPDCAEPQRTVETRGTLDERPLEDGQEPTDGIPIDLDIESIELTPRLSVVSMTYNAEALCGSSQWIPEQGRSVAGCGAVVERGIVDDSAVPQTEFNRYFVDGRGSEDEGDDILYLGALDGPSREAERPVLLDLEIGLTRRGDG